MGKIFAILFGLAAMAGGVLLVILLWGPEVLALLFACIPIVLFFGGFIAFIAGISGIKDAARVRKLKDSAEEETPED